MQPIVMSPATIIVRLFVWSALIAGATCLWPRSEQSSSIAMVESTGVRLIGRSVESADGTKSRTPLEIYLPPQGVVWEPASENRSALRVGVEAQSEAFYQSPAARAQALGRRPAVIAIHGGSWIGGSPRLYRLDRESTVLRLARSGFVVLAPAYRLARPGNPSWPAMLDELREVVRWARRHAAEFGIDPDRIAALGQSAGGQLAVLLGALPDEPGPDGMSARVNAVIDFYGPSDLARLVRARRLAHEPVRIFLGERPAGDPAALRNASPIAQITGDSAPMLLLHGADDAWVPLDQSVRLAAALEEAKVHHKFLVIEGARHGFEAQVNTAPKRDLLPEILDFLRSAWNRDG